MKKGIASIAVGIILVAGLVWFFFFRNQQSFGAGAGQTATSCNVTTIVSTLVGPKTSKGGTTILPAKSNRAWARVQPVTTSTAVFYLGFGSNAILGGSLALVQIGSPATTGTTTASYLDFGRNTDFPYTGAVTAINDTTASSSMMITECLY